MTPILELKNVCKRFGGVITANDVSLDILPGELHGLIGPNGAGKSTLMNLISGIYEMDSGEIYFEGKDISQQPSHKRAQMGIGRTFQTPRFLTRSSIRDNLYLGVDLHDQIGYLPSFLGKKGADATQELEELMEYAGFKFNWDDDISSMPFGKRKLLEIVRAMLSRPKVILVDEPAAGLNTVEIENVNTLLHVATRERNIGILLIEHRMDMVMSMCDRIDVLCFGEIIASGSPTEIVSNPRVIEAYLGG